MSLSRNSQKPKLINDQVEAGPRSDSGIGPGGSSSGLAPHAHAALRCCAVTPSKAATSPPE